MNIYKEKKQTVTDNTFQNGSEICIYTKKYYFDGLS